MKKFLIKILIICSLLIGHSFAEIIKKIEIKGNKRISNETILVLSDIKPGVNFTNVEINDSLKKLYDTNFFADIKISLSNGLLKIDVLENPIIEDIEIVGLKNKTFLKKISESMILKKTN